MTPNDRLSPGSPAVFWAAALVAVMLIVLAAWQILDPPRPLGSVSESESPVPAQLAVEPPGEPAVAPPVDAAPAADVAPTAPIVVQVTATVVFPTMAPAPVTPTAVLSPAEEAARRQAAIDAMHRSTEGLPIGNMPGQP